jgi:hypothetical protein
MPDSRVVRHREHPFFSEAPPELFVKRLERISFSLAEEESILLADAVTRVRTALDTIAEKNLFALRPYYATRSDELAVAAKQGVPGAFNAFVLFHRPLARKAARMLVRWVGMDEEDGEQIAMLGILAAARRFDPARGYQFSTYASYWIRQLCQRYGVDTGLLIRFPTYIFWPCYKLRFEYERLLAGYGPIEARERFALPLNENSISPEHFDTFVRANNITRFSDLPLDEWNAIRNLATRGPVFGPLLPDFT